MEGTTKVRIDLKERVVELEGSEEFVTNQLEWLRDLVLSTPLPEVETPEDDVKKIPDCETEKPVISPDRYKAVFGLPKEMVDTVIHTDGNNFNVILKKVRGNSAKEQMITLSLLHCLASEFSGAAATTSEIRELCKTYGCLDPKNFAGYLRESTSLFLLDGKKRSPIINIRLTMPGKKEAQTLLASYCNE